MSAVTKISQEAPKPAFNSLTLTYSCHNNLLQIKIDKTLHTAYTGLPVFLRKKWINFFNNTADKCWLHEFESTRRILFYSVLKVCKIVELCLNTSKASAIFIIIYIWKTASGSCLLQYSLQDCRAIKVQRRLAMRLWYQCRELLKAPGVLVVSRCHLPEHVILSWWSSGRLKTAFCLRIGLSELRSFFYKRNGFKHRTNCQ